jgi:hypothetical protein
MKRNVWIVASIATLAIACGGNNAAKTAQQGGADNAATAQGNITVAGCLARADETPGSVGTAGSANPSAANPPTVERFVLRQAQPTGPGSAPGAVGTSGSGVSYTLSGDAAELRGHAGQQVEVLGRLDSMTSDPGSQRLVVTSIRTVADTCANP